MKKHLYRLTTSLASVFAFIAAVAIKPNSFVWLYEPEIPEELKK